ncbi:uncharacterized protein CTRU02_214879 [Colletotrichum truncatum]|uniref:Uncharacterized protein n=1 Tax=Colletotrichum truncatum TaxID=5467 RepID=A0ACC3YE14_COLTU|nr:uncharacterized protein CTRU02_08367 [Colletotrichum truncatum]KAF6790238.1 hypothetical protein CTRU02_08367 [Colletotrichum truncatum]
MSPTILVVGATGNTGRGVVETLSRLLNTQSHLCSYSILALTRSKDGTAAKQLATLPHVEVVEKHWVTINADWLRHQNVKRAFIASHNQPNQFAEESNFYVSALNANVQYVVRISTTAANVRPDSPVYYPRSHWAIEALLDTTEFRNLWWTSLQPNVFTQQYLASAVEWVKAFQKTGKKGTLKLMASKDVPVGIVDPNEVGAFAAHLLLQDDPKAHSRARYVLNGPVDITGQQIVDLVESYSGTKVDKVIFKDLSFIEYLAKDAPEGSRDIILSIKRAQETAWEGRCTASTTSKEVTQLAPLKRVPSEIFKEMIAASE